LSDKRIYYLSGLLVVISMLTTTILPVNVNIYAQNENISKFTFPKGFLESLQKDVSGHYSNPAFGIEDIVFPEGWHGRQIPTGIGLIASVRPGNQSGDLGDLFGGGGGGTNPASASIQPLMLLQVLNNSAISKLGLPEFSISKDCKELAANSTSIIDGKSFHVSTIECPFSSASADLGINLSAAAPSKEFNVKGIGQSKIYEYKTTDRTYRLALLVSSPLFGSSQQKPDITKYIPLVDATAKSLKLKV
jgi:hypothetical protein